MKFPLGLFIVTLWVSSVAVCFAVEPPKPLIDGFEAYKKSGFNAAWEIWMKGSPLEGDATTRMNMKGGIAKIEAVYGKMIGYEILKSFHISPSTNRTYAVMLFEKGPIFLYVDCYRSPRGWIIPDMKFHTRANEIFPPEVIFGK